MKGICLASRFLGARRILCVAALFAVFGGGAAFFAIFAGGTVRAEGSFDEARGKAALYRGQIELSAAASARGDAAAAQGHRREAAVFLREATALYEQGDLAGTGDAAALGDYASLCLLNGDADLAAVALRRAVVLEAVNGALWLDLGMSLSRLGEAETTDAKEAFEGALAVDPSPAMLVKAHAGLAELYKRAGLFDLARDHYEKAAAAAPQDVALQIALAALDIREGKIRRGSDTLDALEIARRDQAGLLGQLLGEALQAFEENRLSFPDTAEDHLAYAKLMMRAGTVEGCLLALERSLALDASNFISWNLLGSLSRQTGDLQRAGEAFRRSLEVKPDQPRTQEALKALESGAG